MLVQLVDVHEFVFMHGSIVSAVKHMQIAACPLTSPGRAALPAILLAPRATGRPVVRGLRSSHAARGEPELVGHLECDLLCPGRAHVASSGPCGDIKRLVQGSRFILAKTARLSGRHLRTLPSYRRHCLPAGGPKPCLNRQADLTP